MTADDSDEEEAEAGSVWLFPEVKKDVDNLAKTNKISRQAIVNLAVSLQLSDPREVKRVISLAKKLRLKWPE